MKKDVEAIPSPPENDTTRQKLEGTPVPTKGEQWRLRRSQRVYLSVPVNVYGQKPDGSIFSEETTTLIVSANGALITMATQVAPKQCLFLVNMNTQEELKCCVAMVEKLEDGRNEVGIGFEVQSPKFWRMNFPPEDWDPSTRKRPQGSPRR